jgi:FkbM family methyltransferase
MNLINIQDQVSGTRVSKVQFMSRSFSFLLRSLFQQNFTVSFGGSDFWLRANKKKLGVDGYLYVYRDDYEPELRDALLRYFQDGWLFIDIGANSGYWSRFIAHRFSKSRIIAFEPAQLTFERLCRNLGQHSDRVHLRNVAVSDTESLAYLTECSDPGSNYLSATQTGKTERVMLVTLDNELLRDKWMGDYAKQCVIKIDVEGFELHVFKGARRFLLACRPIIIFEFLERHLTRAHSAPGDIITFLTELNYDIFGLSRISSSVPLQGVTSVENMLRQQGNFIALPN